MFVVGSLYRIGVYTRTPAPLKIPTTPAPTTSGGVVLRMVREVVLFESLFKANLWTWVLGWLFHAGLALVLLRHLRYFTEPVWGWVAFIQPFGMYAGFTMVLGVAGLWARRIFVERVRYISTPSDHLMLALFLAIGVSGLAMRFVAHGDVIAVKGFMLGLMHFDLQPLPAGIGALCASVAGRAAVADLPVQQAAACARGVLLAEPQPGRRSARETPFSGWAKTIGIGEIAWRDDCSTGLSCHSRSFRH